MKRFKDHENSLLSKFLKLFILNSEGFFLILFYFDYEFFLLKNRAENLAQCPKKRAEFLALNHYNNIIFQLMPTLYLD